MESLEFTLKLLSPAFIAGANSKLDDVNGKKIERLVAEDDLLRVPSLRGIFRFWFRAFWGAFIDNIENLKNEEALIFGDEQRGQGIRITPIGYENAIIREYSVSQQSNIGYLGYGPLLFQKDKNGTRKFTSYHANASSKRRDGIMPNALFHFRAIGSDRQIEILKKLLILLHLFGAVGSRSRRGFGSIAIVEPGNIFPSWENDIKKWVEQNLVSVRPDCFEKLQTITTKNFTSFSNECQVAISDPFPQNGQTFEQILKKVAELMLKLRNYKDGIVGKKDHDNEYKDFKSKTFNHIPSRLAFGMPYKAVSRKTDMGIDYYFKTRGEDKTRRASPLMIKVLEAPDGQLHALALFLKSQFFGDENAEIFAKYLVQKKDNNLGQKEKWAYFNESNKMTDWSAVTAFLDEPFWETKIKFA